MPVLKNARHEKFAQALSKGKTADDAHAEAGFKPDRGNASRLHQKDNIRQRVTWPRDSREFRGWSHVIEACRQVL